MELVDSAAAVGEVAQPQATRSVTTGSGAAEHADAPWLL
jgi:hypothetical protein